MGIEMYLAFAVVFLFLGLYCILTKKSIIKSAIGISIMVKGGSLSFLVAGGATAQVSVVLDIVIDAISAAVLLCMAVNVYKHTGRLDFEALKRLWG